MTPEVGVESFPAHLRMLRWLHTDMDEALEAPGAKQDNTKILLLRGLWNPQNQGWRQHIPTSQGFIPDLLEKFPLS